MDLHLLQQLLREGESSRLDYKSQQYDFVGAADDKKAELLKDVLAMANAWREVDAYILIGAKAVEGQPAALVGITSHLDDSDLQQFVNSKTNRPIDFSYFETLVESLTLAVIRVPVQRDKRPFFLKKPYGALSAHTVYLRRGSSTAIADPDEVQRMGVASSSSRLPSIRVEFADAKRRVALGARAEIRRRVLKPQPLDKVPDLRAGAPGDIYGLTLDRVNKSYWRELQDPLFVREPAPRSGSPSTTDQRPPPSASARCSQLVGQVPS